jgi:hypothetical protein
MRIWTVNEHYKHMDEHQLSNDEKRLLIDMENVIATDFFNHNGGQIPYPLTYEQIVAGEPTKSKRRTFTLENTTAEFLSARYQLGSNELRIFKALYRLVRMLREKQGFSTQGFEKPMKP